MVLLGIFEAGFFFSLGLLDTVSWYALLFIGWLYSSPPDFLPIPVNNKH